MVAIAAGVICIWDGTNAGIPANFTRITTLDGNYPRGAAAGVNPGGTGGSATHVHASPAHSHTGDSHTHLTPVGSVTSSASVTVLSGTGPATIMDAVNHTHYPVALPSTGFGSSEAPSWGGTNSDPPAVYTVIWLQSNGTPTGFPVNASVYWNQSVTPTGWSLLVATAGAFLKGAPAGADGGSTLTNALHTHGDAGHSHSFAHSHGTVMSGVPTLTQTVQPGAAVTAAVAAVGHGHNFTSQTNAGAADVVTHPSTGATSAEPPFNTLAVLKNTSGGASLPAYAIGAWLGTLATIPAGWQLCDGTNGTPDLRTWFVKGGTALADSGTTGGALGHGHDPAQAEHAHNWTHFHTFSSPSDFDTPQAGLPTGAGITIDPTFHQHPISGQSTTAQATTSATVMSVTASTDSRPPYVDVAFIMYVGTPAVAITSPTAGATETLPSFSVAWTFDVTRIQTDYRLYVYASDGVTVVYDSGTVVSTTQSATVPAGYLADTTTYKLAVVCTDSGHAPMTSAQVSISTSWTAPPTPGGETLTPIGGT